MRVKIEFMMLDARIHKLTRDAIGSKQWIRLCRFQYARISPNRRIGLSVFIMSEMDHQMQMLLVEE